MRRFTYLPALVSLLATTVWADDPAPGNDSILEREMRADLGFLAGDGFRGRLTGTPENELASEFVATRFARFGLKPIGPGGTYSQPFHLVRATLGARQVLEVRRGDTTRRFEPEADFTPQRFSPSVEVQGPLAFAGFGISAPGIGHDDYAHLDVKGKIVLVLDHEPGENAAESPFDGVVSSEAGVAYRKAFAAQARGAVGILFVTDVHNHAGPENFAALARGTWPEKAPRLERYLLQDWVERVRIPAAMISIATARALVEGSGASLEDLARSAEKPASYIASDLGKTRVRLATSTRQHVVPDRNVVAALEGSDPTLKNEWIIIGCHQDHDGAEAGRILNGADDNGSGTIGMLEIAEAFALAADKGHRPRRSILFAAFNSEERGLLGSWAFVEHPLVPLDTIAAVLNMDMIGRDEEVPEGGGRRFRGLATQTAASNSNSVHIMGYTRSSSLASTVEHANTRIGLRLKKDLDNNVSNLLRRSDQWPFLQAGVPSIFFHTGLHPDYHTADDRPEKIRYAKMEKIARLVHQSAWDLAQDGGRPRLDRAPVVSGIGGRVGRR